MRRLHRGRKGADEMNSLFKHQVINELDVIHKTWLNDDLLDRRNQNELIADFAVGLVDKQQGVLVKAIVETNQILSSLLPDPKIPEDIKGIVRERIAANRLVLKLEESEVTNAKS